MTQVFISALSTTRLELNEEDLQYYNDQKNKEILEVRQCLDYLHYFHECSPKQRIQTDLELVWKSLTILAKILGYQQQLQQISKLHLPQTILLQHLLTQNNLFTRRAYGSYQVAYRWNGKIERYLILLEGVVQKQFIRNSIMISQNQVEEERKLMRQDSIGGFGRVKKGNRKKFARTDEQIPICLNSKRLELRSGQNSSGFFRALSPIQVMEVDAHCWKKFISSFQKIEEQYILNFIRKKLNISLNIDLHRKTKIAIQGEENCQQLPKEDLFIQKMFSIENHDRKTSIDLLNDSILLMYQGQVLVETSHYKIETSRGCILNSFVYQNLTANENFQVQKLGTATAKTDSIIIKLELNKFRQYLQCCSEDQKLLFSGLKNLEKIRRTNQACQLKQKSKLQTKRFQSLQQNSGQATPNTLKMNYSSKPLKKKSNFSLQKILTSQNKNTIFLPNRADKFKQLRLKTQEPLRSSIRNTSKFFVCDEISNKMQKKQKAAHLISTQCSRKNTVLNDSMEQLIAQNMTSQYEQCASILNNDLFKDCLSCVQTKSDLLKKAIKDNRKKKIQLNCQEKQTCFSTTVKSSSSMMKDSSSGILKKKIKELYMKTQGDPYEDASDMSMLYHHLSGSQLSARHTFTHSYNRPGHLQQLSPLHFNQNVLKSRGVMKKVQKGQIRRIRIR